MTDGEREIAISRLGMECIDLGCVYRDLGRALGAFGARLHSTRPDECERFLARFRATAARADARAAKIEDEIREANRGLPSDGPDKWTVDLDKLGSR